MTIDHLHFMRSRKVNRDMVTVMESIMLICFGLSWPITVYKSLKTHSTTGKSPLFMSAILIGYLAGISGKIMGGQFTYVLALYLLNFSVVSLDLILYFKHRKAEQKAAKSACLAHAI